MRDMIKIAIDIRDINLNLELAELAAQAQQMRNKYREESIEVYNNPSVERLKKLRESCIKYINATCGLWSIVQAQVTEEIFGKKYRESFEELRAEIIQELKQINGLLCVMQWKAKSHN